MLKPGGHAFFSVANISSEAGWRRFASQGDHSVGGFFFYAPSTIELLCSKHKLKIVKSSHPDLKPTDWEEAPPGHKDFGKGFHDTNYENMYVGRTTASAAAAVATAVAATAHRHYRRPPPPPPLSHHLHLGC